jgi:GTP-binding protein Era
MVSAATGSGVDDLKRHLAAEAPIGAWHYPEDEITDATERATAAEITRERIYEHLHDELPYAATVETTAWKDLRDGGVRIEQTIFVERESQRRIVLGEGGRTIKLISMQARTELAEMFERPVHLFLFVKVREGWENDPERYREMGLDFPKE